MLDSAESPEYSAVDWTAARRTLRRLIAGLAGTADPVLVDDLVQEGCVRLLRVSRRAPIRETEALLVVLARRTWYDHLRRLTRTRERFQNLGDDHDRVVAASPAADPRLGDPAERLALAIQELFAERGARECLELLRHFLAEAGWRDLAAREGVTYSALRKRWSRCLAVARTELAADADLALWLD